MIKTDTINQYNQVRVNDNTDNTIYRYVCYVQKRLLTYLLT